MTVRAFKIGGGTQGAFTKTSRMVWPDRHLYKKNSKNREIWPQIPQYRPPTVPSDPETYFFVFPDPKIGGGVPNLVP